MSKRGFTLIELVVVIAIIMVIAGLLFPVFAAVKQDAQRTACFANFRNAQNASSLYLSDYDDHFMLSNQHPEVQNSRSDHTWVQVLLPYMRNFDSFKCPSDYTSRPRAEELFDEDLVPGDTISRYYQMSRRSNIGYNNVYLAPFNILPNGTWLVDSKTSSDVATPSQTLQFVDTAYQVLNGVPSGGGSYLASPPCRFEQTDSGTRDTFGGVPNAEVFAVSKGWDTPTSQSGSSAYIYGGAWPWHNGRVTVIYTDGHGSALTIAQLSEGCNVRPAWQGLIQDLSEYRWSLKL